MDAVSILPTPPFQEIPQSNTPPIQPHEEGGRAASSPRPCWSPPPHGSQRHLGRRARSRIPPAASGSGTAPLPPLLAQPAMSTARLAVRQPLQWSGQTYTAAPCPPLLPRLLELALEGKNCLHNISHSRLGDVPVIVGPEPNTVIPQNRPNVQIEQVAGIPALTPRADVEVMRFAPSRPLPRPAPVRAQSIEQERTRLSSCARSHCTR